MRPKGDFMEVKELAAAAKRASYTIMNLATPVKNKVLLDAAEFLINDSEEIIEANKIDLEKAKADGMSAPMLDRLTLDKSRIEGMANGLRDVAALSDPIGEISDMTRRPNGLMIGKKRVPLGVVGIIYEARPNVTSDAFAIAFKSGNACILRGGSAALHSCTAIVKSLKKALTENNIDENVLQYIEDTSHESTNELITLNEYVDLVIPRGGRGLIENIVKNATVPAIHTGTGNCHVYVDEFADLDMAVKIIVNAKTKRLGVCNACESLVVHSAVLPKFVPMIAKAMKEHDIEVRADARARAIDPGFTPATEEDWSTEYLDRIISLKTVDSVDEAIEHINKYNTKHSETIVTENTVNAQKFLDMIDAACVYLNASTRFTDGGMFGLGAEIGISTQKIHARGPMGLKALTCEKYIIIGNGQVRE